MSLETHLQASRLIAAKTADNRMANGDKWQYQIQRS
jgi:hypothetical protein